MGINLPDNKLRLEIKKLADETRVDWAKKGLTDIFMILDNAAILIRSPLNTELSGFCTYFKESFTVFTNSNLTLGHERFTGAHELYHLTYEKDIIKNKKLLDDRDRKNEDKAQMFAAEFLMPEDGVKELFYKRVNLSPNEIEPKHIVRIQNPFKVSYAAMLKRFIHLELCDINKYEYLRSFGSVEKADELVRLTKQEGFDCSLIKPSKVKSISDEFIEIARSNYEKGKISYDKLDELLDFIGKTSEDYGYTKTNE